MIVNYSNQPFESAYDMNIRTRSPAVLYQDIETVRITSDNKVFGIPHGLLKATHEDYKILNKLKARLNNEYRGKISFEVSEEIPEEEFKYLARAKETKIYVPRINKIYTKQDIELVPPLEFKSAEELVNVCMDGIYLCVYKDKPEMLIHRVAKSDNALSLINMSYSIKLTPFWKFALVDARKERDIYTMDEVSVGRNSYVDSDKKMSQEEVDKFIQDLMKAEQSFFE